MPGSHRVRRRTEETATPKFLGVLTYSPQGFEGLQKDTARGRREAVRAAIARLGGTLESSYFTANEGELFMFADFPDTASTTAVVLAVSIGDLGRVRWTEVLSAEAMDQAFETSAKYRSWVAQPGR